MTNAFSGHKARRRYRLAALEHESHKIAHTRPAVPCSAGNSTRPAHARAHPSREYLARILVSLILSGCIGCFESKASSASESAQQATAPPGSVLAAWSQIVGPGETASSPPAVVARFVVQGTGQDCGAFTLRSVPETAGLKPAPRNNPDPSSFPITLCQAPLPADWSLVALVENQQPTHISMANGGGPEVLFSGAGRIGRKHKGEILMITIGDTGCRGKKDQAHCSAGDADWPFYNLLKTAASRYDPDFVIHVGDFRYYQEGNTPDTWHFWDDNVRAALQTALENRTALCDPECSPRTVLSGHIHLYQKIELFAANETSRSWVWPQTVIVGNGGVANVEGLNESPCAYDNFPVKVAARGAVSWSTEHGFVAWRRSADSMGERSGW